MASAKQTAMNYLGNEDDYINLSGLNTERQNANDVYKTNTTSFQNAYNDLLNTIASNRNRAKTDFGSGRATVNENAFLQNRSDVANLASRGLSGGIAQLSKLGNRMETGRQYSDLANTYYNTLNELDATEKTGTDRYNTNMETAKNTLNAALADIDAREKTGRNQYRAAVAQLAEQIQARWAAQAAAQAQLDAQREANRDSARNELINRIRSAINDDYSTDNLYSVAKMFAPAIGNYMGENVDRSKAFNFMYQAGLINPNKLSNGTSSSSYSTTSKTGSSGGAYSSASGRRG